MLAANKVFAANEVDIIQGGGKKIKKSVELKTRKLSKNLKLSKSRNLKGEKLFTFQKSARSGKKLLKSGNSSNFNAKKNEPSFLTPNARAAFNCLWLTFIEILIL